MCHSSPPKPSTSLCVHPRSWAHTLFPYSSHTPVPSLLSLLLLVGWRPRRGHFWTGQRPCVNSPAFLSSLLPGPVHLRHPGLFLPKSPATLPSAQNLCMCHGRPFRESRCSTRGNPAFQGTLGVASREPSTISHFRTEHGTSLEML